MSTSLSEDCAICGKSFKRLGAHLVRSLACGGSYYMPRRADTDECRESEGADHGTRPNLRSASYSTLFRAQRATVRGDADDEPPIINVNGVDDEDFGVMDDDDGFPNDNVDEEDVPSDAGEGKEGPDAGVLDLLYLKLFQHNISISALTLLCMYNILLSQDRSMHCNSATILHCTLCKIAHV